MWDTGEHLAILDFSDAEQRYGAPYLLLHRGDLHAALLGRADRADRASTSKLVGFDRSATGITLRFADGSSAVVDAVIGADGVHSKVREMILRAREAEVHRPGRAPHHASRPL